MSHVFETRCVSATLIDPAGVARVACIGDSMMFGFCAPSRDTLPSHLGRILNQAYPERLVFVDNFGETSGNIWDAWPLFKLRAQTMRFDAVVFSVCQNDLDLFATHGAAYRRYHLENFQEGSPQWNGAVDLFGDVKAWRDASGLDVLVIFYSFHQTDRPMIDRLAPLLASLDLPFIDMLAYYQSETAVTIDTYRVSEFDGHPSSMAHELAARRVARAFRTSGFLGRAAPMGADKAAALTAAVRSMIDQGVAADFALLWSLETAGAKAASAKRRLAAGGAGAEELEFWQGAERRSREGLEAVRRRSRRKVRSAMLEKDWHDIEGYFSNLTAYRRRLEAAVFVLVRHGAGGTLAAQVALLPDSAFQQAGRTIPFTFDGDLAEHLGLWRARMDKAAGAMGMVRGEPPAPQDGIQGFLPSRMFDPSARDVGVEGVLIEEFALIDRQVELLEDFAKTLAEPITPDTPEFRLLWAIFVDLDSAFIYIDRLVALLKGKLPLLAPCGLPWTIVEVAVDGAVGAEVKDRTFDLVVELTYGVPRRGVIRDRQLGGAVKERGVYRFEFPLMIEGSVRVRVPERGVNQELFKSGLAKFAAVKVGNADWAMDFPADGKIVQWVATEEARDEVDLVDIVLS